MALRLALISLLTITATTLTAVGLCVIDIERTPFDTAIWDFLILGLVVAGYLLMAGCWLLQLRRARRACDAAAESWQVLPLLGSSGRLRAPYLPNFRYRPGRCELQRFLWDPAINRLRPGDPVVVRRSGRVAVVDLPDGTRLWPLGTLRTSDPRNWTLTARASGARAEFHALRDRARADDRGATGDLIRLIRKRHYLPVTEKIDPLDPAFDVPPEPVTTWPRPGYMLLLAATGGAGLGVAYGPLIAIAVAIYTAGVAVHTWGWYGSDPEPVI
jgi:hypothetical protein